MARQRNISDIEVPEYRELPPGVLAAQKKLLETYPAESPLRNEKNHAALLKHLMVRIAAARQKRDANVTRWEYIDRELQGYLEYTPADAERKRKQVKGEGVQVTDTKLPLAYSQLDEMETFMMGVFMPNGKMFEAQGTAANQDQVKAIVNRLNKDSKNTGLYEQMAIFFRLALHYNFSGATCEWQTLTAPQALMTASADYSMQSETSWQGNVVTTMDPYNTFYDPAVHPVDVPERGEYFGYAEGVSQFDLIRQAASGQIVNADKVLKAQKKAPLFWRSPPKVVTDALKGGTDSGTAGGMDWDKFVGLNPSRGEGVEQIHTWIWLFPGMFGLTSKQIGKKGGTAKAVCYRITIAGGCQIVAIAEVPTPHARLPAIFIAPNRGNLAGQERSAAEILIPFQTLASFMYNVFQRATRKKLYGLVFYHRGMANLDNVDPESSEASHIAVSDSWNKPIEDGFGKINDAPDVENTMSDIGSVIQMMQHVLPTEIASQIASLERATQYQAAALVQATNKRNHKMALIAQSQGINKLRFMHLMNLAAAGGDIEIPSQGKDEPPVKVSAQAIYAIGMEEFVSDGLKAIDKALLIQTYQNIIGMLVQVQGMNQKIDLLSMIDYLGSLMGDETDLSQFRTKQPIDQLPPELQAALNQLLQSGQLNQLMAQTVQQMQQAANGTPAAEGQTNAMDPTAMPQTP